MGFRSPPDGSWDPKQTSLCLGVPDVLSVARFEAYFGRFDRPCVQKPLTGGPFGDQKGWPKMRFPRLCGADLGRFGPFRPRFGPGWGLRGAEWGGRSGAENRVTGRAPPGESKPKVWGKGRSLSRSRFLVVTCCCRCLLWLASSYYGERGVVFVYKIVGWNSKFSTNLFISGTCLF